MSPIEGLVNFRDVGGMPLVDGGTVRSAVLFRSDALHALSEAGRRALGATDIGTIVDFRTPAERQLAPDVLPAERAIAVVELSILEGAMTGLAQQFATADPAEISPALIATAMASLPRLGELYVSMLAHSAAPFAEVARLVAASRDDEPTAVLVHCTAGKDRTGVAVALLLDAVGVERDAIVADYAASERNLAGPWADAMTAAVSRMGVPLTPEIRALIAETPPAAIEQALDWLDAEHGGAADYLRSGGLTDDELAALRFRLRG